MLSPVRARLTGLFDLPAATGFFKSVSGMGSETEDARPSAEGLIAYNGHAGLGANAVGDQHDPTQIEFPNIA